MRFLDRRPTPLRTDTLRAAGSSRLSRPSARGVPSRQGAIGAHRLCNWYNQHADFFYQYVYGDKDTFRFAWHRLGDRFSMPGRAVGKLSRTLVQFDFHGQPLFQHRCLDKWSLGGNCRIPRFIHEARCLEFIDELRRVWQPRFEINGRRDESLEKRIQGCRFIFRRQGSAHWPLTLAAGGMVRDDGTSGLAYWWGEVNRLVLADADGRVSCRLTRPGRSYWQGTNLRDQRQRTCLEEVF